MHDKYDSSSVEDIIIYAKKAEGKKISELIPCNIELNKKDKGAVGNYLQEYYFGIPRNSSIEPDFEKAGIELKAFGYWDNGQKARADQRLALSKINYMEFEKMIPFEESHLYHKCRRMLFVMFLLKMNQVRLDSEIKYTRLYELQKIIESDYKQIVRDYYIITKKIRDGKAHDLSEGDTEFLGAARTGDKNSKEESAPKGDFALPRRFALKQSYMSYLINEYIVTEEDFSKKLTKKSKKTQLKIPRGKTFENFLSKIDKEYYGKKAKNLVKRKAIIDIAGKIDLNTKASYSRLGFAMLGIKSNSDLYLRKTNTVVKSVRINKNGKINEKWSFPPFSVEDLINQEWEESEVFNYLSEQRILIMIFKEIEKDYVFVGHCYMKFTAEQLEAGVKQTWIAFKEKVVEGMSFELELIAEGKPEVSSDVQGIVDNQYGLIKLHATKTLYDIDRKHIRGVNKESEEFLNHHTVNGRYVWNVENKESYGCKIENGDWIAKQSFWLKNEFILDYLHKERPDLFEE